MGDSAIHDDLEFGGRKAPYAPISALREFFARIPDLAVPARVDRKYIQKQNVASNNEWALLSALKFLGVIDAQGAPTHAYRLLQTTDRFQAALRHLVESAYRPLFEAGGATMSGEDLENYFRVASSPSQAKNAARFFREACSMAGIALDADERNMRSAPRNPVTAVSGVEDESSAMPSTRQQTEDQALSVKSRLLEKLPAPRPEWSAAEYEAICSHFVAMLRSLDASAG